MQATSEHPKGSYLAARLSGGRESLQSLLLSQSVHFLRKFLLTITVFTAVLVAGVLTGTVFRDDFPALMGRFGWGLEALKSGHLYDLWVILLFSSKPGPRISLLFLLLWGLGWLEFMGGTKAAALGFFVTASIVSIVELLLLWPIYSVGATWLSQYLAPDMGSSSAALVCWGIAIDRVKKPWNYLLIAGTVVPLLTLLAVLTSEPFGLDHLISFVFGLGVGLLPFVRNIGSAKV